MRWLVIFSLLLMTGCSGRITLSDVATGAGATVGALVGTATSNPAVILTTTTAGAAVGAALVKEAPSAADVCIENPEACVAAETGETIRDFIHWIIGGGVLLIIVAWLIPGPQSLWRRQDARTNPARKRVRSARPYS